MATIQQHVDFRIDKVNGKSVRCPMCGQSISMKSNHGFAIILPNGVIGSSRVDNRNFNLPKGSKCSIVGQDCFKKLLPIVSEGKLLESTFVTA